MIRGSRSRALAAALALVIGFAVGAYAQDDGPGRRGNFRRGPGRGAFVGLAQLGLTDAQREQVRGVMDRHRGEMQEAGKRMHDAHEAQRAAAETVPVNEGLIRSTTQTLANSQTDMAILRARIHSDVWSLLTPEQQQKAKELKAQRETRAKERLQRRKERRQG